MYHALDGRRSIEVKTMEELFLGRQKGGRGRLIEVKFTKFPILFYNYFGALVTDRLTEGGRLM